MLDAATDLTLRRPGLALAGAVVALALAGLALARMRPETDVAAIVRTPAGATLARASETFGLEEEAFILVELPDEETPEDPARLAAFADALVAELEDSGRFADVRSGMPLSVDELFDRLVLPHGPLWFGDTGGADGATPERLARLLSREGLRDQLEKAVATLSLPGLGELDAFVERDPLELHRPLLARLQATRGGFDARDGGRHLVSRDGRAILVTASARAPASRASEASAVVAAVSAAADAARARTGEHGIRVGGTGAHFLAEESERIIRTDLIVSMTSAFVVAVVLLAFGLRLRPTTVLLICLPTLWGSVVGVGAFVALRPELAILSLGCSAVLIGLGIDFTIHLSAAALAEPDAGDPTARVRAAVRSTRGALILATLTSMAAFGAFTTSRQAFLRDMGVLTGLGLLACLLGALLLLPPILAARLGGGPDARAPRGLGAGAFARLASGRPGAVLGVTVLLSVAAALILVLAPIRLEDDLRDIHAADSAPLAVQARIAARFGGSREPLQIVVEAPDEAAAVAACHALEPELQRLTGGASSPLRARSSVASVLPPIDAQRRAIAALAPLDPARFAADLRAALEEVGFDAEALAPYVDAVAGAVGPREPLDVARLRADGLGSIVDRLVRTGADGRARALVLVYPTDPLWAADRRAAVLDALDGALRAAGLPPPAPPSEADADAGVTTASVTGLHVVSAESAAQVALDFRRVSLITAIAVLVVMVLRFRRPTLVLLVLAPAALGSLFTAATLSIAGYELNMMNLGVIPMVLAIGIDDGIHIVHRHLHHLGAPGGISEAARRATTTGVVLTSLTTMVTFGSLGLSRNQGIASVGVLTLVGVGACLLLSVLALPAALELLVRRRDDDDDDVVTASSG